MCQQIGLRMDIVNNEYGCYRVFQGLTAHQLRTVKVVEAAR